MENKQLIHQEKIEQKIEQVVEKPIAKSAASIEAGQLFSQIINHVYIPNETVFNLTCLPELFAEFKRAQDNPVCEFTILITRWRFFRLGIYTLSEFKTPAEMLVDIESKMASKLKEWNKRENIMIARSFRDFKEYKLARVYYEKALEGRFPEDIQNEIGALAIQDESAVSLEQGVKFLMQYKKKNDHFSPEYYNYIYILSRRDILTLCEKIVTKSTDIEKCEMYQELAINANRLCIAYYKNDEEYEDRFYCNRHIKNIHNCIEKLKLGIVCKCHMS